VSGTRRLAALGRPYTRVFGLAVVAGALASAFDGFTFSLLIPFLRLLFGAGSALADAPTAIERVLGALAGPWLAGDPGRALVAVMLLIVGSLVLKNAALYLAGLAGVVVQEGIVRDLRVSLYRHLQRLGLGTLGRTSSGQVAARLLSDPEQVRGAVYAVGQAIRNAVLVLVYLAILFALSWRLSLVVLALAPAITLLLRPMIRRIRRRAAAAFEERGRMASVALETTAGARVVKAHAGEPHERERFELAAGRARQAAQRGQRLALAAAPMSELLGGGALLILLLVGMPGGVAGDLRPELFVTFVAVALRILSPAKSLAQFPAFLAEAEAGAARVFEILDRPPEDDDPPGALAFPGLHRELEFRDVWVAYEPDTWALAGLNLRVARGEMVAIVGPSGAGKSTLVDLLPRFVDPARGAVLLDGVPLARYTRRTVRAALGIVSQDVVLFNDTVRANIAYGDRAAATDQDVRAAARAANAHEFIERLPLGYQTPLGERGFGLSGGERQRIAIARALLRDPAILILDEATAALDAQAEREVQEALMRLCAGRTVFVIAHRLSTVARADRVVVLENGRVVEAGTHDQLLAADGTFSRMRELQAL
jgi:ABC-type multidrug transport system fused ATPase/permease subunit